MIPISVVDLGPDVEASVLEVLRSGRLAQGPKVAELEQRFAGLVGVRHAVAVNNGTTALVAALRTLSLQPGDEVLTSPFTFVATVNAALEAGATVRFADIAEADFNVDPTSVADRIGNRTRVLLPVHLYGQPADMDAIDALAREHDLAVVEDAAQAAGARVGGRGAGSYGIGCFSLYATKNLTSGEGGMLTTDDDELADRLRLMRNQGMRERYAYEMAGHNYRMTDLQAAVALPQIDRYAEQVCRRRANAAALVAALVGVDGVTLPQELPGRSHVWHQFTVLLDPALDRAEVAARMAASGVTTGVYYPRLVHDYDCYRGRPDVLVEETPVAAGVAARCLSLPVHGQLTPAEVEHVGAALRQAVGA